MLLRGAHSKTYQYEFGKMLNYLYENPGLIPGRGNLDVNPSYHSVTMSVHGIGMVRDVQSCPVTNSYKPDTYPWYPQVGSHNSILLPCCYHDALPQSTHYSLLGVIGLTFRNLFASSLLPHLFILISLLQRWIFLSE